MGLQDALHQLAGQLNYVMVEAHREFGSEFEVKVVKDKTSGIYLVAVEVVEDDPRL